MLVHLKMGVKQCSQYHQSHLKAILATVLMHFLEPFCIATLGLLLYKIQVILVFAANN